MCSVGRQSLSKEWADKKKWAMYLSYECLPTLLEAMFLNNKDNRNI